MRLHVVAIRRSDLPTGEGHRSFDWSRAPRQASSARPHFEDRGHLPSTAPAWRCASSAAAPARGARPGQGWFRLRRPVVEGEEPTGVQRAAAAADFGNGVSWVLPPDRWIFVNPDLSPAPRPATQGEWIGLDAVRIPATRAWRWPRARSTTSTGDWAGRHRACCCSHAPTSERRPDLGRSRLGLGALHQAIAAARPRPGVIVASARPGVVHEEMHPSPSGRPGRRTVASPGARSPTGRAAWPGSSGRPGWACGAIPRSRGRRSLGVSPRPRRPLPLQRQRVPRGHARRLQGGGAHRSTSTIAMWLTSWRTCSPTARSGHRLRRLVRTTLAEVLPDPPVELLLRSTTTRASSSPAPPTTKPPWPPPTLVEPAAPRRPLHPLHGRHDRHAQGRALAPERLPGGLPGCHGTSADLVATATRRGASLRTLPAPPFMHGAAHWNAISALVSGGTVVVQDDPARGFDPADVLATVEREQVSSLQIVGEPSPAHCWTRWHGYARPLALRFLLSGGAVLSAPVKADLLERIPGLTIVDVLGSSETGRQAVAGGRADVPPRRPHRGPVRGPQPPPVPRRPGDRLAGAGRASAPRVPGRRRQDGATFPMIDGIRHAVAGDRVRLLADGTIELLGATR